MKRFFTLIILLNYCIVNAQQKIAFKSLRYDDDINYFKNDSVETDYKRLKFIPVNKDKTTYISTGGEVRLQYFNIQNEDWGDASNDNDGFILTRYLLYADFHANSSFRFFFQLQSSNANGRINPNSIENNPLDIHQAFFDVNFLSQKQLILRAGRQELSYGSQRLIAVRELPNSRLAFDGIKIIWNSKNIKSDLFYMHPVVNREKIVDDAFNNETKLWGSYTVLNNVPLFNNIDIYYLGFWRKNADFDEGTRKELRHTIGTRVWKNKGNFNYDFEAVYQFGKVENLNIKAWTISSNTTYQFENIILKPTIGLKSEIISGNKKYDDNSIETFNPLFPKGAYFGLAALIGPSNLFDIHPSIDFEINSKINFSIDYDAFWRYSKNDGIYAPNQRLIYSGTNSKEKFIGSQIAGLIVYQYSNHLSFKAETTWFHTGKFIKDSGSGKDIVLSGLTMQYKF
ncbi:alginate export family protein [Flavobacterium aquatile]|uniref:Alginate export domain-containing protein n=1 Tax=Flavobacterium aquatile LMG 4008 = ATCC 11947 TaxID=1453498 RepID=A0A095SRJ9_9FLAO|nr:alginate export family protein [Flavobacterium aquatile]KGD66984.1 hypothetical protein LG45_16350 [Flavobacterium aquatile LMG 4008 = ATCC 11947]OXA68079.1 hypothetical protein B0A61_06320 [Flavobacterium aquatile LMG 4008 = ATCC 11947]GEC80172.1 alginate export family protein [Flavobacterium aquatile]